ncbi:CHRD domain-containing protein [Gemmatimonas aurantiaca]|nr:CHRD domain-containing protein [Gemmatimonas aurantiaca]
MLFAYICALGTLVASVPIYANSSVTDSIIFEIALESEQENDCAGSGSDRSGFAILILNADSSELSIHIEHNIPLADITGVQIHLGDKCDVGIGGHLVVGMESPIDEVWALSFVNVLNLLAGKYYVNIHTVMHPEGDIRGQIQGCCETPGDADNSASLTIGDVTFLIARIFSGGPAPVCCETGDSDASGTITIADVTYLIARIFSGGLAPVCGPVGLSCGA